MNNKHYTNKKTNNQQIMLANKAMLELAKNGIEIITIIFRKPCPCILVNHCLGNKSLNSHYKGQGNRPGGQKFIRKVANVKGCQVQWTENVEQVA